MTHIQTRRDAMQATHAKVMELLNWGDLYLCNYKYNCGLAYLKTYLHNDTHTIQLIERSKVFWNWWKNHWQLRDEEFIMEAYTMKDISQRRHLYHAENSPEMLASTMSPHGGLLDDTYAVMIDDLIKEKQ